MGSLHDNFPKRAYACAATKSSGVNFCQLLVRAGFTAFGPLSLASCDTPTPEEERQARRVRV